MVNLDLPISSSLFPPDPKGIDAEILARGSLPRDALIDRFIAHCTPYHVILRNDEDISAVKPRSGAAPKIEIILETRGGNKTATRVHGLEDYFLRAQPLADELRKTCAGSTSVESWTAGGKGKMEVMVQGPQKEAVVKALEKRGVDKRWIEFLDKTKGKKK
jgi:translation initiation factor 2D